MLRKVHLLEEQLLSADAKQLATHLRRRLDKKFKQNVINEGKRDLLVFMLGLNGEAPCAAAQRPSLRDVLSKRFFRDAEGTLVSQYIEVRSSPLLVASPACSPSRRLTPV